MPSHQKTSFFFTAAKRVSIVAGFGYALSRLLVVHNSCKTIDNDNSNNNNKNKCKDKDKDKDKTKKNNQQKNCPISKPGPNTPNKNNKKMSDRDSPPPEVYPQDKVRNMSIFLGGMRIPYFNKDQAFTEDQLVSKEPFGQFNNWFERAAQTEGIEEPNAMCLATASKYLIQEII